MPINISPESFHDNFVKKNLLVRLNRLEETLTLTGRSLLTLLGSLGLFAEFQLITDDCVKVVLKEMPKKVL